MEGMQSQVYYSPLDVRLWNGHAPENLMGIEAIEAPVWDN
jgi:hypothetical protein